MKQKRLKTSMDLDNRNILSSMSPIKAFNFESWRVKNKILKEEAASRNDSVSNDSAAEKHLLDDSPETNTLKS